MAPHFFSIKKHYIAGNAEEGGMFKIQIGRVEMEEAVFLGLDLSGPIYEYGDYRCDTITAGVNPNSGLRPWDINVVASTLFSQRMNGDVIFTFDDIETEQETLPKMRQQLIELGMDENNINF